VSEVAFESCCLLVTRLTFVSHNCADEDHISPTSLDPDTCVGKDCFELTHLFIAILSLTCVVSSSFLMVFTSRYAYSRPVLGVSHS
jgi:hypothetical protein